MVKNKLVRQPRPPSIVKKLAASLGRRAPGATPVAEDQLIVPDPDEEAAAAAAEAHALSSMEGCERLAADPTEALAAAALVLPTAASVQKDERITSSGWPVPECRDVIVVLRKLGLQDARSFLEMLDIRTLQCYLRFYKAALGDKEMGINWLLGAAFSASGTMSG